MNNLPSSIHDHIASALNEDIQGGDITASLIPENEQLSVRLVCRENAVLCGIEWFNAAFRQLDSSINIHWANKDGDKLKAGQVVCKLNGNARSILSAERTALNFLQTLSATASITRRYQKRIKHTDCRILDTRKTIPNLRLAQKYAVTCGGGLNHRLGLYDAFLLKENHLAAAGNMAKAVTLARSIKPEAILEVEVEDLAQLSQAIDARVDRVLLDNFELNMMQDAVTLVKQRGADKFLKLEASGNITKKRIKAIAETGVDFISIGALTKHVKAVDFSLRFID